MNVIIYESISDNFPYRSKEEIVRILKETKTDMILRGVERSGYITQEKFNIIKEKTTYIKSKLPNIKIIGILYAQSIARNETDDITDIAYSEPTGCTSLPNTSSCCNGESYQMALDPSKYGLTDSKGILITKCNYQLSLKQYHGTGTGGRWRPDITNPDFQTLLVHQAERLINAGCDGVWIDMFMWQAQWMQQNNKTQAITDSLNGTLTISNRIKNLRTLSGNVPSLSTWVPYGLSNYLFANPNYSKGLFDFFTLVINSDEIISSQPDEKYIPRIEKVRDDYNNVPVIPYIDWGNGLHPTWWFTQSILDPVKRKQFQINILKTFTDYFKTLSKQYGVTLDLAYPVHGMPMCNQYFPKVGYESPCNVLSFNKWTRYDSLAPEFDTYQTIKELMNPSTSNNLIPILLGTGLLGIILIKNRRKKKKIRTSHQDFVG